MKTQFHRQARRELAESAEWYEARCQGLSDDFLDEVEKAMSYVLEYPEGATMIHGTVRQKLISRFPYALMYKVKSDHIRILAVAHLNRRPFYWKARR